MSDPITTHVLDQLAGQPAGGVEVSLASIASSDSTNTAGEALHFTATTATDSGRIAQWKSASADSDTKSLASTMDKLRAANVAVVTWRLTFSVKEYWRARNVDSFYPRVEVVFETDLSSGRTHWHVPVLLGPFGYTTYRGT